MKYVEIVADAGSAKTVVSIAEQSKAHDVRIGLKGDDGKCQMRVLVHDDQLQSVLDKLQSALGAQPTARIVVLPVETALPKPDGRGRERASATATRETLYEGLEKNSRLDANMVVLVILSTIVAAIGLIENNVAVVIGAMVIAPLLGPNLAFSLGTALGDIALMRKAALTLIAGIAISIVLSTAIGVLWPSALDSHELMSRTVVGLDSIALALASGAAAALSLTTGLSSVLVGVMVAVALLPPAATLGLMLGSGELALAFSAGLLLAVNIVCVNLSSKLVFFFKGIRPRTWFEKEKAKRAMVVFSVGWLVTLMVLVGFIYARSSFTL